MRWKYTKLLLNLGNALEALCGLGEETKPLRQRLLEEGEAALLAAGIPGSDVSRQQTVNDRTN
jgi:2-dehydropantoate 2-reductase